MTMAQIEEKFTACATTAIKPDAAKKISPCWALGEQNLSMSSGCSGQTGDCGLATIRAIAHSAMMLFARITSPQRRASSLMKAAVSAGVLPSGSTLSVRKRCCTSGILSTSMVALAI